MRDLTSLIKDPTAPSLRSLYRSMNPYTEFNLAISVHHRPSTTAVMVLKATGCNPAVYASSYSCHKSMEVTLMVKRLRQYAFLIVHQLISLYYHPRMNKIHG
jgi:hypothetical protein